MTVEQPFTFRQSHVKAFVKGPLDVSANTSDCFGMRQLWIDGILRARIDGKGTFGPCVVGEVHEHSESRSVVETSVVVLRVFVFEQRTRDRSACWIAI